MDIKFVGYYIQDPNILRLIDKYLKTEEYKESKEGSVQGGNISPYPISYPKRYVNLYE